MPRGKRTNTSFICKVCSRVNYVSRLKAGTLKDFLRMKFCNWDRKRTEHRAKEIKGGY